MRLSTMVQNGLIGIAALVVGCSTTGSTSSSNAPTLVGVWANSWNTTDMIDTATLTLGSDLSMMQAGTVSLKGSYVQEIKSAGKWSSRDDSLFLTSISSVATKDSGKTWTPLIKYTEIKGYRWSVAGDTLRLIVFISGMSGNDTTKFHRVHAP